MAQPKVHPTRQSGPEAKEADAKDALHKLPPGGPIKNAKQGFVNPGPTDNLRGIEPNTARHKGTPNPEQAGTDVRHGDHNPPPNDDVHGHGVPLVLAAANEKHSAKGSKVAPPQPNAAGVRK